ncbi:hypothetical protein MHBO_001350 [Bonamia ostreae]|uniref:Uncharacterized protein n=1 Tax=Bonamia ostreae TaxID=126728 RepID=A0ABV2AJJ5_9EUKA
MCYCDLFELGNDIGIADFYLGGLLRLQPKKLYEGDLRYIECRGEKNMLVLPTNKSKNYLMTVCENGFLKNADFGNVTDLSFNCKR